MTARFLTDFELMVMLAILRVRDDAYGVPIARELEETAVRNTQRAFVALWKGIAELKGGAA